MTKLMIWGVVVSFVLAAAGCPDDDGLTPRAACEDASVALCERVYACLSPQEVSAAGFPSSESACVVKLDTQEGCAAKTNANVCDGNERYQPGNADACIDQLTAMSCAQLRSDLNKAAPACNHICEIE